MRQRRRHVHHISGGNGTSSATVTCDQSVTVRRRENVVRVVDGDVGGRVPHHSQGFGSRGSLCDSVSLMEVGKAEELIGSVEQGPQHLVTGSSIIHPGLRI